MRIVVTLFLLTLASCAHEPCICEMGVPRTHVIRVQVPAGMRVTADSKEQDPKDFRAGKSMIDWGAFGRAVDEAIERAGAAETLRIMRHNDTEE